MNRKTKDAIVKELIGKLKELPDGTRTTTARLLRDIGRGTGADSRALLDIHFALLKAAEKEGIALDGSGNDGKDLGLPYNLDFVIRRDDDCESAVNPDDPEPGFPRTSPIYWFDRYLELIFAKDELWEQFQMYVRQTAHGRNERFFAFHRDPECIEIWRQMLDNMGGGFPLSLFAAAAFILLSYRDRGHDLDAELEQLKKTNE